MAYDLYPAIDENYSFPPEVRIALAKSIELRHTVIPMSTATRNNLTTPELWDGRVIANVTTDRLERYDLGTLQWVEVADSADADAELAKKVSKTGDTMTGPLTLSGNPATALQAAPKQYVESWAPHIIVLASAAPIPGGTPAGTVIIRTP